MPRRGSRLLAALLGAVSLAADAASQTAIAPEETPAAAHALLAAEPTEAVERLLGEGWILLDRPGDSVTAYVVFERPVERVYELLAATSRQREYRGELDSLATVAQTSEGPIDEHHISILFVDVSYRLRYRLDPEKRRIAWVLDPDYPTPMRRIEGRWELYEMDLGRTLGRLSTGVDVGEALPDFLEEAVTRRSLPRTLEGCRRWVNADGGGS